MSLSRISQLYHAKIEHALKQKNANDAFIGVHNNRMVVSAPTLVSSSHAIAQARLNNAPFSENAYAFNLVRNTEPELQVQLTRGEKVKLALSSFFSRETVESFKNKHPESFAPATDDGYLAMNSPDDGYVAIGPQEPLEEIDLRSPSATRQEADTASIYTPMANQDEYVLMNPQTQEDDTASLAHEYEYIDHHEVVRQQNTEKPRANSLNGVYMNIDVSHLPEEDTHLYGVNDGLYGLADRINGRLSDAQDAMDLSPANPEALARFEATPTVISERIEQRGQHAVRSLESLGHLSLSSAARYGGRVDVAHAMFKADQGSRVTGEDKQRLRDIGANNARRLYANIESATRVTHALGAAALAASRENFDQASKELLAAQKAQLPLAQINDKLANFYIAQGELHAIQALVNQFDWKSHVDNYSLMDQFIDGAVPEASPVLMANYLESVVRWRDAHLDGDKEAIENANLEKEGRLAALRNQGAIIAEGFTERQANFARTSTQVQKLNFELDAYKPLIAATMRDGSRHGKVEEHNVELSNLMHDWAVAEALQAFYTGIALTVDDLVDVGFADR